MNIIDWTLAQLTSCLFSGQWADSRLLPPIREGLIARMKAAVEFYPCDLLLVHRDAEAEEPTRRYAEVIRAAAGFDGPAHIAIVPVRMQEAWLLIDESAIRTAAGNPRGGVPLALPRLRELEGLPDPKSTLFQLLKDASELTGRKLRNFDVRRGAHRVAELITDYSPLRELPAFQRFEVDLAKVLEENGWTDC